MLFDKFQCFSKASGLIANLKKSSFYCGGVPNDIQDEIVEVLGFSKGVLPIRYLGVPLSSKRVSIVQCQPLLDKMLVELNHGTLNFSPMLAGLN